MTDAFLGLDTSCYTTSVALVDVNGEMLCQKRRMLAVPQGGRGLRQQEMVYQHTVALPELMEEAFAGPSFTVRAVAASAYPRDVQGSYMPAFLPGVLAGRAAALSAGVPFFMTDHQSGHIAAALYGSDMERREDFLAMHLSGGTTEMLRVTRAKCTAIGGTQDISFGQLVDRTGVLLGLPFPAGPSLEQLATQGSSKGRLGASVKGLYCSVSGAEAEAARLFAAKEPPSIIAAEIYDFLARTAARLLRAAGEEAGLEAALLAGGVASSGLFRSLLAKRLERDRTTMRLSYAKPELCGDNALGVARIAWNRSLGRDPF